MCSIDSAAERSKMPRVRGARGWRLLGGCAFVSDRIGSGRRWRRSWTLSARGQASVEFVLVSALAGLLCWELLPVILSLLRSWFCSWLVASFQGTCSA